MTTTNIIIARWSRNPKNRAPHLPIEFLVHFSSWQPRVHCSKSTINSSSEKLHTLMPSNLIIVPLVQVWLQIVIIILFSLTSIGKELGRERKHLEKINDYSTSISIIHLIFFRHGSTAPNSKLRLSRIICTAHTQQVRILYVSARLLLAHKKGPDGARSDVRLSDYLLLVWGV